MSTPVRFALVGSLLLAALPAQAETVNLQQAVQMSLAADPRIKEREQVVEAARGMMQEVQGNAGWRVSANAFIGLAPKVEGGFYKDGNTFSGTTPRTDGRQPIQRCRPALPTLMFCLKRLRKSSGM